MFIARDKDNKLFCYSNKPNRGDSVWGFDYKEGFDYYCWQLDIKAFPYITWDTEPVELSQIKSDMLVLLAAVKEDN